MLTAAALVLTSSLVAFIAAFLAGRWFERRKTRQRWRAHSPFRSE